MMFKVGRGRSKISNGQVSSALNAIDKLPAKYEQFTPDDRSELVSPLYMGEDTREQRADINKWTGYRLDLEDKYGRKYFNNQNITEERNVDVSRLESLQREVVQDTLKSYIRSMGSSGKVSESSVGSKYPIALYKDGRYVLIDGNHRAVAAKLLGWKKLKIKVIDIDKYG